MFDITCTVYIYIYIYIYNLALHIFYEVNIGLMRFLRSENIQDTSFMLLRQIFTKL